MDLASGAVDDKAQGCVVCLGFMGHGHVELDNLPKLNEEIERKSPKLLLVEF